MESRKQIEARMLPLFRKSVQEEIKAREKKAREERKARKRSKSHHNLPGPSSRPDVDPHNLPGPSSRPDASLPPRFVQITEVNDPFSNEQNPLIVRHKEFIKKYKSGQCKSHVIDLSDLDFDRSDFNTTNSESRVERGGLISDTIAAINRMGFLQAIIFTLYFAVVHERLGLYSLMRLKAFYVAWVYRMFPPDDEREWLRKSIIYFFFFLPIFIILFSIFIVLVANRKHLLYFYRYMIDEL